MVVSGLAQRHGMTGDTVLLVTGDTVLLLGSLALCLATGGGQYKSSGSVAFCWALRGVAQFIQVLTSIPMTSIPMGASVARVGPATL